MATASSPDGAVVVRFWAGARRAAGHESEELTASTLTELRAALSARAELAAVVPACSFLVNGKQASPDTPLTAGDEIDVLPPFAGG